MESVKEEAGIILQCNVLQLRRKSSTSWLDCKSHHYSLYLTGDGDQCDVSSKNSEGSGGWSDSWDEGTGGHHWVHQAGVDSKSASKARASSLLSFGSQLMRRSLSAELAQTGSGISMTVIRNKTAELLFFFSFIICPAPFLLPFRSAPAGFSQLLSGSE